MKAFIDFRKIVLIFLVTRLLLLFVGVYSRNVYPNLQRMYDTNNEKVDFGSLGTMFHGWDSVWEMKIANEGYPRIDINKDKVPETVYVFFPLYPLVSGLIGKIIGSSAWGAIVVSNLCLLLSGIVLYKLIELKSNKNLGLLSAIYLFVFPLNYIFSAIQSESLFLLLLLLCFYFLEKKKFLYASIVGFFLALTKYVGFIVSLPIFIVYLKNLKRYEPGSILKLLFYITIPVLGILVYGYYLYTLTNNPMAILVAERGWSKALDPNILKPFLLLWSPQNTFLIRQNFILALSIVALAFVGAFRLGLSYILMVMVYFLIYLSTTSLFWHIFSLPRYFIILFPVYFYLATLSHINWLFKYLVPIVLFASQLYLFFYWTTGWPIPM